VSTDNQSTSRQAILALRWLCKGFDSGIFSEALRFSCSAVRIHWWIQTKASLSIQKLLYKWLRSIQSNRISNWMSNRCFWKYKRKLLLSALFAEAKSSSISVDSKSSSISIDLRTTSCSYKLKLRNILRRREARKVCVLILQESKGVGRILHGLSAKISLVEFNATISQQVYFKLNFKRY
jgi:hypothetical protein